MRQFESRYERGVSACQGECFDVPISFFERCLWCERKFACRDQFGELADRDSDFCRMLHKHLIYDEDGWYYCE